MNPNTDWATLSRMAVANNRDGRLEVFLKGPAHDLWHAWQVAPNGDWSDWESLGGIWPSSPTAVRNQDGRLEVFARGEDGQLWHSWQVAPNGVWSGWSGLSGNWPGDPAVTQNADGRLEAFQRTWDGRISHAWQTAPNAGWTAWSTLNSDGVAGDPCAAVNADGRLELFWFGSNRALWHAWQDPSRGRWSDPQSLGGTWPGAAVPGRNADGRLEVFLRGEDRQLWHAWQDPARSRWSAWTPLGGGWSGQPAVGANQDGRLEVFLRGDDSQLWHAWQVIPNGDWSEWEPLGGDFSEDPTAARNADERLEVFVRHADGQLAHQWQSSPNNGWSWWDVLLDDRLAQPPRTASRVPPSGVQPIPGPDKPLGEPNWRPLMVPGGRSFHRLIALTAGGPQRSGECRVELRGWLRAVADHPESDHDWTYDLEPDAAWLDGLGCRLQDLLRVGNIIDHIEGRILIGDRPRTVVSVPCVHCESVPWGSWRPWPCPEDWSGRGADPGAVYAFPPRQPSPQETLNVGNYVRMVGALITDVPHDANPANPWNPGGDGGPARWTEMHPVDLIQRLPDRSQDDVIYGVAVWASNGIFSGDERTLDTNLPFPASWPGRGSITAEESVLPGTNLQTIVEGNTSRTGASVAVGAAGVHIRVKVRGQGGGGLPGKFAALYRLRLRP